MSELGLIIIQTDLAWALVMHSKTFEELLKCKNRQILDKWKFLDKNKPWPLSTSSWSAFLSRVKEN